MDGKKAKKKFNDFNKKKMNSQFQIQNNYILLGNKNNLVKKFNVLEQYNYENKIFFDTKYKNYSNELNNNDNFSKSTQEI